MANSGKVAHRDTIFATRRPIVNLEWGRLACLCAESRNCIIYSISISIYISTIYSTVLRDLRFLKLPTCPILSCNDVGVGTTSRDEGKL